MWCTSCPWLPGETPGGTQSSSAYYYPYSGSTANPYSASAAGNTSMYGGVSQTQPPLYGGTTGASSHSVGDTHSPAPSHYPSSSSQVTAASYNGYPSTGSNPAGLYNSSLSSYQDSIQSHPQHHSNTSHYTPWVSKWNLLWVYDIIQKLPLCIRKCHITLYYYQSNNRVLAQF